MRAEKKQIQRHFARAARSYNDQAMIQCRVADRLLDLVRGELAQQPAAVLEIGCCTGLLTRRLLSLYPDIELLEVNDLVAEFKNFLPWSACGGEMRFLAGDIETIPLPRSYQLIISSSTFHWLHGLEPFFSRLKSHLLPGGLLAFSMYGPDNLAEIRNLIGKGLDYPSLARVSSLLEERFELCQALEKREELYFPGVAELLRHLRETGVNALPDPARNRGRLRSFSDEYERRYRQRRGVRLSYHPMYFLARRRRE